MALTGLPPEKGSGSVKGTPNKHLGSCSQLGKQHGPTGLEFQVGGRPTGASAPALGDLRGVGLGALG